jgi:hypothetical protein
MGFFLRLASFCNLASSSRLFCDTCFAVDFRIRCGLIGGEGGAITVVFVGDREHIFAIVGKRSKKVLLVKDEEL